MIELSRTLAERQKKESNSLKKKKKIGKGREKKRGKLFFEGHRANGNRNRVGNRPLKM